MTHMMGRERERECVCERLYTGTTGDDTRDGEAISQPNVLLMCC